MQVEFPTGGLDSVCGDDDGCAEMNASLGFLRTFCQPFQQQAANTRIFFPDADVSGFNLCLEYRENRFQC